MLKLRNNNLKDFGVTKEKVIKVYFKEYKDFGIGEDREYIIEYLDEEEMERETEHLGCNTFVVRIEECFVYKQNKVCLYCKNYNSQRCYLYNKEVDLNDCSCDSFE